LSKIFDYADLHEEAAIISCVINEAREKLAVDLDPALCFDRWPPLTCGQEGGQSSFLVVGSSHASKLGAALTRQ
jgi:hypothetical protein